MTDPATPPPEDAVLKARLLEAALSHIPFDGFTDSVLERAGLDARIDAATQARLFPKGALDLLEEFSTSADQQMLALLAEQDLAALPVRERIAAAVWARLDALRRRKEAARRAAAVLTLPPNAGLGAKLLWRTVDEMWRAVGDTSTDFNFYTKRGILAGVLSATLLRWFNDTSEDESATRDFLDRRIQDVMNFEKLKAQAKKEMAKLPSLEDFLKRLNRGPSA
ncbi:MAG TPA: COQ9 family protein [Rhizomicrobium sp.]|nr:COQ9 family protein [Rhizomicrobium sp.]